jgi:DMSO/TMAO reductase YedYZ heme-binding membrane subunit
MRRWIISGIVAAALFISFFYAVKETEMIWLMTRALGLLAFLFLFISVLLGELRVMHLVKGDFTLHRFHAPAAIFSLFLVFLHFMAAVLDNYQWGAGVSFLNYLGFSFSDKWLAFLSLGTLAFYLMLVIGFTSANMSQQLIGYKRWKLIHYLSYLSFAMAYIHSTNLGTDLRHSGLTAYLNPLFVFMFFSVTALLLARVVKGTGVFEDQSEVWLAGAFFLILILGGLFLVSFKANVEERFSAAALELDQASRAAQVQYGLMNNLTIETDWLQSQIEVLKWEG